MSKTKEIIEEMAKLTILTNAVNDVQLKNLKSFPLIFFDGINHLEMEYDLSNDMGADTTEKKDETDIEYNVTPPEVKHMHVTYRMKIEPGLKPMSHLDKRFEALEKSVRSILWNHIKVTVFFDTKKVYESKMP